MEYGEFQDRIEDGYLSLNEEYWVCDWRYNNGIYEPATRNIAPTRVKAAEGYRAYFSSPTERQGKFFRK